MFGVKRFDRTHFRQLHALHKAINPLCAYVYAIFTIPKAEYILLKKLYTGIRLFRQPVPTAVIEGRSKTPLKNFTI